jgi:hypothetical protein
VFNFALAGLNTLPVNIFPNISAEVNRCKSTSS